MICLVTALAFDDAADTSAAQFSTEAYIPLGLLSLTAVLEEQDLPVEIVDLNMLFEEVRRRNEGDFCEAAARVLADYPASLFGFSSICSSYPLTIRIAQLLRQRRTEVPIIFGGPQASAVHLETLRAFPWVDVIVRGEAEITFPELVGRLMSGRLLYDLAGISYRAGGEIRINPPAALVADLDALPIPAYHRYPIERFSRVRIDAGRGCPFACTFCSTNDFFRRRYRLKSPSRLLAEMRLLDEQYGVTFIVLTHDMFTIDKKKVRAFCQTLRAADLRHVKWGCSARIDCVDASLLADMAEAGCTELFFGVETGSASVQREIKKKLKTDEIVPVVQEAHRHGIRVMNSFITGFPTETLADLRDTLHLMLELVRYSNTQLHLLAPLPGTPLHQERKNDLAFDGIYSDISPWEWEHENATIKLITDYPEIFPNFYYIPSQYLDRKFLGEVRDFFVASASRFRWLTLVLYEQSGDYLKIFEAWRSWLGHHRLSAAHDAELYYFTPEFHKDFLGFAEDYCKDWEANTLSLVKTLVEYERTVLGIGEGAERPSGNRQYGYRAGLMLSTRPLMHKTVAVRTFPFHLKEIIQALQTHRALSLIRPSRTDMVFQRHENGQVEMIKVPPLTAGLLRFCDGQSTVADIILACQKGAGAIEHSKIEALCFSGLEALQKRGLISFSTAPEEPLLLQGEYSRDPQVAPCGNL